MAPTLLGRPLAPPRRRLGALLVDLVFATLVATFLAPLVLGAIALTLLRSARRPGTHGGWTRLRQLAQVGAGATSSALFLLAVASSFVAALHRLEPEADVIEPEERALLELSSAPSDDEAFVETESVNATTAATFVEVESFNATTAASFMERAQINRYAEALEGCLERLAVARKRPTSLGEYISLAMNSVGLTLGWVGAYFTLLLTWRQGQTPGKRMFRIRVVRLDGRKLGYWDAFERFSGYGAGLATGLLGFLQIYWDRNRQAIHDKITSTVVIDETERVPSGSE